MALFSVMAPAGSGAFYVQKNRGLYFVYTTMHFCIVKFCFGYFNAKSVVILHNAENTAREVDIHKK